MGYSKSNVAQRLVSVKQTCSQVPIIRRSLLRESFPWGNALQRSEIFLTYTLEYTDRCYDLSYTCSSIFVEGNYYFITVVAEPQLSLNNSLASTIRLPL